MKVYCPSCGTAVHYAGEKPRFCSKCGDPISIYAKQKSQKKAPQKKYKFSEDIDIEEDPIEFVPQIDGLDIEIEPLHINKSTLGQIMKSTSQAPPDSSTFDQLAPTDTNQTKEEFLKQFEKEAGSIRPKKKDA